MSIMSLVVGVPWSTSALLFVLLGAPLTAQVWTQVATTGPIARGDHAMAFDSVRGRTLLFGGRSNSILGDTWEWDGASWLPQIAAPWPPARYRHAMVYDTQRQRTVLFGGTNSLSGPIATFDDTWEWNGSVWTQAATIGPIARADHAMAYDSQRGRTVLFGGLAASGGSALGDTWEWDGTNWQQATTTGPLARVMHAMAYDSTRGKTVMFGGYDDVTLSALGDTWEWNGTTWTNPSNSGPPARWLHAMAFDSHRDRTVLFGGGYSFADTWEWDGTTWTLVVASAPSARMDHAMAYDSQRDKTVLFGGGGSLSTLRAETWEWTGSYSSIATAYGNGCGNPPLLLSPVAGARPIINTTAQASLSNIPTSLAFVALGWSRSGFGPFPLPLTLAGYGLPGCELLQSLDAAAQATAPTGQGTATYSLPLPNWSGLIGLNLHLQGWAAAPGVNAGGMVVSNGVEWVIGST